MSSSAENGDVIMQSSFLIQ